MFYQAIIPRIVLAFCLFGLVGNSVFAASPNLWWDHSEPLSMGQAECVKKAKNLMMSKSTGKLIESSDAIWSRGNKTTAIIECLKFNDELRAMVLVSSSVLDEGHKLFENLKKGMAK